MEQQQQQQQKKVMPQSELHFHLLTTNAMWGDDQVSPSLREKLNKYFVTKDQDGQVIRDKEGNVLGNKTSLWDMLGFYTRDMRLANLSVWNGEVEYCQYFLDLANDFLQADMIEPFVISLSRVATLLELSQSKGGFLRRMMNTLRHETLSGEIEPPKKKLFSKNEKKGNYGGI